MNNFCVILFFKNAKGSDSEIQKNKLITHMEDNVVNIADAMFIDTFKDKLPGKEHTDVNVSFSQGFSDQNSSGGGGAGHVCLNLNFR